MSDDARRPRWALVVLLVAVAVVVIIALVAVFTRGAPAQYAADTPEGVVQRYSQAVVDGDTEAALEYVVPEIAASCDDSGIGTDEYRVTLLKTTERDDTARVGVLVTTVFGSGPLGSNEYESEESFDLVKSGGSWLIGRAPWQLAVCYELGE